MNTYYQKLNINILYARWCFSYLRMPTFFILECIHTTEKNQNYSFLGEKVFENWRELSWYQGYYSGQGKPLNWISTVISSEDWFLIEYYDHGYKHQSAVLIHMGLGWGGMILDCRLLHCCRKTTVCGTCTKIIIPYFSIDKAHLMYNAHPRLFRHSFWCIDNAHDAN
jgi:hypothetical protein